MALRHAFTNKIYVFVNVLGLVMGFTAVFLIGLYLKDELSYDRHHQQYKRIHRIIQIGNYGGIVERSSSCPFPLGPAVAEEFSDRVEGITRLYNYQSSATQVAYRNIVHKDRGFFFADSGFFDVFTTKILHSANNNKLLTTPYSAVITRTAALRYFGYIDVVGKELTIENSFKAKVEAVVDDWPESSHFRFSVLVSMETLREQRGGELSDSWVNNPCWTYIKLTRTADANFVQKRFPGFVYKHFSPSLRDNNKLLLQPLTDIHLTSNLEYEIEPNGNIVYVYIFGGIALFLIIMAIINYINLTTATFAKRAKEVAIKKILGASESDIKWQLIFEAFLIIIVASVISLVLAELLLPWFNSMTEKQFQFPDLFSSYYPVVMLSLVLLVVFIGGLYPVTLIAGLFPSRILRGNLKRISKTGVSRKILVVIQMTISTLILFAAFTIHGQYNYLLHSNTGLDRNNLLIISTRFTGLHENYVEFKQDLEEHPSILRVTASDDIPGIDHNRFPFFLKRGTPDEELVFFAALRVMSDFSETYRLNLTSGRSFNADSADREGAVIVNGEMIKYLSYNDARRGIGTTVSSYSGSERVIGVFSGFYPKTLHKKPEPFVLDLGNDSSSGSFGKQYIAVRYRGGESTVARNHIQNQLKKYLGKQYVQVDEYQYIYTQQYAEEKKFSQIAAFMSVISIIISVAGLLGLFSFLILYKSKAISIRKIYGASYKSIFRMFAIEFVHIYTMVALIAFPLSWYLGNLWLNTFAASITFSLIHFIGSLLIIGLMIIAVSAIRMRQAASVNPASVLRYE
ncbi:MAG: ABC transporter permease [Salinivirgaceae bacterium]|jgi:putative ABC transport system permease protein|nr:ABC transporter permease [Salinivirgaceae bacterium]